MHLRHRIGVAMLAGVFVIMLGPSGAWAASQAGGLPAVSDRVSVLEGIVATLRTAVTTLTAQVTALQTANTGLQNALNAEIAGRTAADTALKNALDQEAAKRANDDSSLQTALNIEKEQRIQGDNALASEIGSGGKAFIVKRDEDVFLPNGDRAIVAALPLPAGSYFLL